MKLAIGEVLSKIMKDKGLTLKEISKGTSVPTSTLGEWTHNRSPKNPLQVKKVANFLGVSLNYLLFGEEDHEEPLQKILKEEVFKGTYEISLKRVKIS